MIDYPKKESYGFRDLVAINHLLRSPGGCPWDQAQDHLSIRRNFLEEVYECCEALDNDDPVLMQEELGDVLMQVVFHADIETDRGRFNIDDVCDGACKKLIFRHPHLFGNGPAQSWDQLKAREKGQKTHTETLDAVARSLPALWRAEKLIKKSKKAGLPWPDARGALDHAEALLAQKPEPTEQVLGELLFSLVCACAQSDQDPEALLHGACEAFLRKFAALEPQGLEHAPLEGQLSLWEA